MLRLIFQHGSISTEDLAKKLSTTPSTVRRDLAGFEKKGIIKRYFGGVQYIAHDAGDEDRLSYNGISPDLFVKRCIAKTAAEFIDDGDTIFINSSSTALMILDYVSDRQITVITNNGNAIMNNYGSHMDIILTGGELSKYKRSLVGEFASHALGRVKANKCFMGVCGISGDVGITSRSLREAPMNRLMLRQCDGSRFVVALGNKIGVKDNFLSGDISDITHLITDTSADPIQLDLIRRAGVEITVCDPTLFQAASPIISADEKK